MLNRNAIMLIARVQIWFFRLRSVGNTPNVLTDQDFEAIGRKTEGYSGSDLSIVVRDAIMMPVRTLQQAQYFKRVGTETDFILVRVSITVTNTDYFVQAGISRRERKNSLESHTVHSRRSRPFKVPFNSHRDSAR